jgi:hypothetical protein
MPPAYQGAHSQNGTKYQPARKKTTIANLVSGNKKKPERNTPARHHNSPEGLDNRLTGINNESAGNPAGAYSGSIPERVDFEVRVIWNNP